MSDPALALQQAVVASLRANGGVAALVGDRVYDQPAPNVAYPYVTLGEDQILRDPGDSYDGSTVTMTLHVWSRQTGFPQAKRIAAAIRAALGPDIQLGAQTRLVDFTFEQVRFLREPDGTTSHAVLTFTALTEPDGD